MRQQAMQVLRKAGSGLGQADDAVQGAIRKHILRLPEDGSTLDGSRTSIPRQMLGYFVHQARPNSPSPTAYRDAPGAMGWVNTVGSRALQVGGLTAAGVGLANLISAFGGPADEQEPGQLSVDRTVRNEEKEENGNLGLKATLLGLSGAAALAYPFFGADDYVAPTTPEFDYEEGTREAQQARRMRDQALVA